VKHLRLSGKSVLSLLYSKLKPFVVPEDLPVIDLPSCPNISVFPEDGSFSPVVVRVGIVLPPFYHLLLVFIIEEKATLVKIRTDNSLLLCEVDKYFTSWE
jgi:hypothetical protein